MKKAISRLMMLGVFSAMMISTAACGKKEEVKETATEAVAETEAKAEAATEAAAEEGIGFPKGETITLAVPGKAGGGSDLGIRYYSEA